MAIYIDKELLDEDESISLKLLSICIQRHISMVKRYDKLNEYYEGKHKILNRTFDNKKIPNNKIVCNHAEYISDMATSYVFSNPVMYSGEGSEGLNELFTGIDEDSHNNELGLDLSILGVGYELLYMNDEEEPTIELAELSPSNTFLASDTTVKHKPLFAVTYMEKRDINDQAIGNDVIVYTKDEIIKYFFKSLNDTTAKEMDREYHYFGDIPIIEYKNNKKYTGDFEGVISTIDAYNKLQSDRVNDKEQLVDAFLVIIGQGLGDDEEEVSETVKYLMENKIIELDKDGDAKWLVKQLNEEQTEVLKKSLKDDIHEFSKVPCLTDENFASNSSGVAMKYKLLGFEQLGGTKERYFKQGLRQRLKLISNIDSIKAKQFDYKKIDIVMKRSLPVDNELLAKISQETEGLLSWETRVKRYDSEIDVEEERNRLEEEKKKNIENMQKEFGSYDFKQEEGEEDENTSMDNDSDK